MNTLEKQLWNLLRGHLPQKAHAQRIETGSTGQGIPDVNICHNGLETWIELKVVKGKKVDLSPEQVSWLYVRNRAGGRVWILARDIADGPRKGKYDRLYLWPGSRAVEIFKKGVAADGSVVWNRPFDWLSITKALLT